MSPSAGPARAGRAVSQILPRLRRLSGSLVLLLLLPAGFPSAAEPSRTPRELAMAGKKFLDEGDLTSALASFSAARQRFAEASAHDHEVAEFMALHLYNLGVRFNNQGRATEALDAFVEVLRLLTLKPQLRDAAFRETLKDSSLGVAGYLVASGQAARTLEAYQLLEKLAPGDIRQALGLGAARLAGGQGQAAASAYARAWRLDPTSAEAAQGRGRASLARASRAQGTEDAGEADTLYEKGIDWLRTAAKLDPGASERWLSLAEGLSAWSEHLAWEGRANDVVKAESEAEAALRRAVQLEPDSPWARMKLAVFLLETHRYVEASDLFEEAGRILDALVAAGPGDQNLPVWREARTSCTENLAAAEYNQAVDAVNRGDFDRADALLERACQVGPSWEATCRSFKAVARSRREALQAAVARHNAALREDPDSVPDLLALGDLHAMVGSYDTALGFYRRAEQQIGENPDGPPHEDLTDRIAGVQAVDGLEPIHDTLELTGGRVELTFYRPSRRQDLESAVKAAWLRVSSSLGAGSLGSTLAVSLFPNQRRFREEAGYRVGSLVKGHYSRGRVSIYEAPSHTVVEWVSVLTHEMAHHAIEKLSAGRAPWWLSEGVARYIEGDSAVVDRQRLAERMHSEGLQRLARLGDLVAWSWNDPEAFLDARDQALLAVEQMARIRGTEGLRSVLRALSDGDGESRPEMEQILKGTLGIDLNDLDASLRASLK